MAIDRPERVLVEPTQLWTRGEVLAPECPVPRTAGAYAWWFTGLFSVPVEGTRRRGEHALLYIGIAPRGALSPQTLRDRIRYHYRGNAEGSTLRLTLGCLLGLELRRVGSGRRMTFSAQEAILSEWMAAHARVCWVASERPWEMEGRLIQAESLPLNLDQNWHHAFHAHLSALRAAAKQQARERPVRPR